MMTIYVCNLIGNIENIVVLFEIRAFSHTQSRSQDATSSSTMSLVKILEEHGFKKKIL